jgi:phage-related protein
MREISGIQPTGRFTRCATPSAVYVLHAFQKKSKKGIATPKAEIDLIEKRLKDLIKEKEGRQ